MWDVKVAERRAPVGRQAWIFWEGSGGWRGVGGFDLLADFSHFQLRGRLAAIGLLNVTNAYLH